MEVYIDTQHSQVELFFEEKEKSMPKSRVH